MFHAGGFTTVILAILDRMLDLDSDCPYGKREFNIIKCPADPNYMFEYCRCTYDARSRVHKFLDDARASSISFANTERLKDFEDIVASVDKLLYIPRIIFMNINDGKNKSRDCMRRYENSKKREENYRRAFHEIQIHLFSVTNSQITLYYKFPPIITVIFICGVIGNVTLLYIFFKNPMIRSGPRILLLNITISALLLLLFHVLGIYYLELVPFPLGERECRLFAFITITPVLVSVFSIMVLSITRYYRIVELCPGVGMVLVWTAASLAALKSAQESVITTYAFSDKTHCDIRTSPTTAIVMFTVTYFLPFLIIGFFTSLKCSQGSPPEDMPQERNVNILPVLAVVFSITYTPYHVFWLLAAIYEFAMSSVLVWFYHVTWLVFNTTHALFPVTLYLSSGMFSEHFDEYLRFGRKRNQKEPPPEPPPGEIVLYSWEIN